MQRLPENAWYFIFSGHRILLRAQTDEKKSSQTGSGQAKSSSANSEKIVSGSDRSEKVMPDPAKVDRKNPIPQFTADQANALDLEFLYPTGTHKGLPTFSAQMGEDEPSEGFVWVNFRFVVIWMAPSFFKAAGFARQVHEWNLCSQYCGSCGKPLDTTPAEELVRTCHTCQLDFRPKISPAMIVAVTKADKILLARGKDFPDKKMFSVLAGFVEPCESLEETVKREVREETGIQVKNITYFQSQPWPFPDTLMIGYTAEYDAGTLCIAEDEIAEAAWFTADNLPKIPSKPTLSRALIDQFIEKHRY